MTAIQPATLAGADLLRQIRRHLTVTGHGDLPTLDLLASLNPDVRKDSLKRSLERLIEVGNLTGGAEGYRFTKEGGLALLGLDVADGLADIDAAPAPARAPHRLFAPNPDQPRKVFDADDIAALADTIEAAGDILQNLVTFPADAHGVRTLKAGEKRWRAVGLLLAEGRCPAILAEQGLPYVEREGEAHDPELVALIENGARRGLTEWEEAQAMLALQARTSWSAREIARQTGRWTRGEAETGIRLVQQRIRVAREAAPEDVAAYQAGALTWEALRKTVERPREDQPTPKQACALVEILERRASLDGAAVPADQDLLRRHTDFDLVRAGYILIAHKGGKAEITPTDKAFDWRAAQSDQALAPFEGQDREMALLSIRGQAWGTPAAFRCQREETFATPWLNVSDDPLVFNGVRFPNITQAAEARRLARGEGGARSGGKAKAEEAAAPPPASGPMELTAIQVLRMAEIHWAISRSDRRSAQLDCPVATASCYWLDAEAGALKDKGLIAFQVEPGQSWTVRLTRAGEAWLAAHDWHPATGGWISHLRKEAGLPIVAPGPNPGHNYWTAWLNPPEAAEAPVTPPAAPAPAQPAAQASSPDDHSAGELADAQHARVAIDQALAQAKVLAGFGDLLETAQLRGPFTFDNGDKYQLGYISDAQDRAIIRVDESGDLPDDLVIAQVQVIAAALNAAGGYGPAILTSSRPGERETSPDAILARALHEAMDWMLRFYTELQAIPGAETTYRGISQALTAAGMMRRQAQSSAPEAESA